MSIQASLKLVILMSACLIFTTCQAEPVAGLDHQRAMSRLIQASYAHLKVAHACTAVLGASVHREARILIENAIRATRLPTDLAFQTAAAIARQAAAETKPSINVNSCLTRYAVSRSNLARARAASELQQ